MFFRKKLKQTTEDDFSAQKLREELSGNIENLSRSEASFLKNILKKEIKIRNKNGYDYAWIYRTNDNTGIIGTFNKLNYNVRQNTWKIVYDWLIEKGFAVSLEKNGNVFVEIRIEWE